MTSQTIFDTITPLGSVYVDYYANVLKGPIADALVTCRQIPSCTSKLASDEGQIFTQVNCYFDWAFLIELICFYLFIYLFLFLFLFYISTKVSLSHNEPQWQGQHCHLHEHKSTLRSAKGWRALAGWHVVPGRKNPFLSSSLSFLSAKEPVGQKLEPKSLGHRFQKLWLNTCWWLSRRWLQVWKLFLLLMLGEQKP